MCALVLRKARSFLRQSFIFQLWFIPVWILLGLGRLAILTFSFKRLAPALGLHAGNLVWLPFLSKKQEWLANELARAIQMAARYTPWTSNCFPQAIAARVLLGCHGLPYVLFFGVTHDAEMDYLKAHAWVVAGRVRVSGGYSFNQFTVVGSFVSPQLSKVISERPNSL